MKLFTDAEKKTAKAVFNFNHKFLKLIEHDLKTKKVGVLREQQFQTLLIFWLDVKNRMESHPEDTPEWKQELEELKENIEKMGIISLSLKMLKNDASKNVDDAIQKTQEVMAWLEKLKRKC